MCVTCLFEVQTLSLLSTKHMAPQTNLKYRGTQYKHTIPRQQNQARQAIEKGWFHILNFL
jgi:hypothetical protein